MRSKARRPLVPPDPPAGATAEGGGVEGASGLSPARYRSIFENSPVGIYESTRDGRILAANSAFAALLGYGSVAEVLALRMAEDIYFDPREREAQINVHAPNKSVSNLDLQWKRKDGTPIEIRLNSSAIEDASGRLVGFEGFVIDVSEQKRNERGLRESEDRYRDLVENSRDLICTHDLGGRLLSLNHQAAQSLGYDREALARMNIRDLLAPEVRDGFAAYLLTLRRDGVAQGRMVLVTAEGERRIWEFHNSLRTEGVAEPVVRGLARDVTERVQARWLEKALLEIAESGHEAESLTSLFRSIHRIVGQLLPAENFYVALYDEIADEVSFPYFVDAFDAAPAPRKPDGLTGEVLLSGEPLLMTSETLASWPASGKSVPGKSPIDWLGVPLRSRDRTIGVLAVQSYSGELRYTDRDRELLRLVSSQIASVIAHKQAESALRESEARYQRVVDNIGDALLIDDVSGRVVFANDRFLDLFGLAREDLDGLTLEDYVAPEMREILRDRHERRVRGEEVPSVFEYEGLRRDGRRIRVEVRVSKIVEGGQLVGTQSAIRDITERKRAEDDRGRLEEELRHALKMEAVGSLAGGVAHDFNNMLAVILGNTEIALSEIKSSHPLHASLLQIRQAADRSVALTRQLLAFARKQTIQPRRLDLNQTVSSMLSMLGRLVGENLEVVWRPGAEIWPILMDPAQVDQILANLAINSRDSIEGSGTLTIETRNVTVRETDRAFTGGPEPGDFVVLKISDTGSGMDEATLARIFEPFFTTKEAGKGTGMGLATVYGIVQQNGGAIDVESAPGRGTIFRIFLPRTHEEEEEEAPIPESARSGGGETVLLVEDEVALLELGKRILERAGFAVLAARTPREALKIAARSEVEIHILVTDVMLPEISGRELSERIEALRPEIRCLYTSGYTADVMAQRGVLEENVRFLAKPYSGATLVARVRNVLDEGDAASR